MGLFKGRKKKGLSLTFKKYIHYSHNHSKLYSDSKKCHSSHLPSNEYLRAFSPRVFKPLKKSTPCLHKAKRRFYSATKSKSPFKSPLVKKARISYPASGLKCISRLSPISILETKAKSPRKSKRSLKYNELRSMTVNANEDDADETILYSDDDIPDYDKNTNDDDDVHISEMIS